MKVLRLPVIAVIAGLCGLATAQAGQQSPEPQPQSPFLENGTIMYVELAKTLDAKKAKPGEEVRATLLADVLAHGKLVLRQDAKLLGHITEVQAFSKDKPESRLGLVIDKVIGKGGQEMAFQSVLIGISPAPRLQMERMSPPTPPGVNAPLNGPQPERHYPVPKGPTVPASPSSKDPGTREESERVRAGGGNIDLQPTDIEGLSLEPSTRGSDRVVVSLRNNVKLESGVRLVLRVTNQSPANKASAQNP